MNVERRASAACTITYIIDEIDVILFKSFLERQKNNLLYQTFLRLRVRLTRVQEIEKYIPQYLFQSILLVLCCMNW